MKQKIYQVDSFTSEPFQGNPAGVCITEKPLSESLMLSIAAEMAVSETAFFSMQDNVLKWFTPQVEVELCGHGTLAAAHIMKETGLVEVGQSITFNTLSGPLQVVIGESAIEMNFPAPVLNESCKIDGEILTHLGIETDLVKGKAEFDSKLIIEVDSEEALLSLAPNFSGLLDCPGRGVAVTAKANSTDVDYVARYFGPWVGINEDPVTGSAHCGLGVYWQTRLGKSKFKAIQASERRGSLVVEMLPENRVKLIGSAVTTLEGVLTC